MYTREELKILRARFWELFAKRCEVVPELKGKKRNWVLHRTKINNVALKFDVGRENAQVMIEVTHKNENQRLDAFMALEKYKAVIEEGFNDGLVWDLTYTRSDSGQEVSRIYTSLDGVDFHRQNQWPDIFNFFIKNMLKLESNFMEVRDLVKQELKK